MSYRKTGIAARALRKLARLLWVPITKFAPLGSIKKWATRRWEENVVKVNSFKDLRKSIVIDHTLANICPYRPCEGKNEGAVCTLRNPEVKRCLESKVSKFCQSGRCLPI